MNKQKMEWFGEMFDPDGTWTGSVTADTAEEMLTFISLREEDCPGSRVSGIVHRPRVEKPGRKTIRMNGGPAQLEAVIRELQIAQAEWLATPEEKRAER